MPNTPEDASIEKINNEPEINSEDFDDNEKNDIPRDDIRKRAGEILEKYGDEIKYKNINERNDNPATPEEIATLVKERTSNENEADLFAEFIYKKFKKPMTRRNFLKLAGTAIAVYIGYGYLKDNIDILWNDFQKEMEKRKNRIALESLVDNSELIKDIDTESSINSPLSIAREYFSKPLIYEDIEIKLNRPLVGRNANEQISIYIERSEKSTTQGAEKAKEIFAKIKEELKPLGEDRGLIGFTISIETFKTKKEEIAKVISSNTAVPENDILNYINNSVELNTSKISVVDFKDFNIYKKPEESFLPIKGVNIITYSDIFSEDIPKEQLIEEQVLFNDLLQQKLEKEGYTISKLKSIAENDPKEFVIIIAQVIRKNVEFDNEKAEKIEKIEKANSSGKNFIELNKKVGRRSSYEILGKEKDRKGKGVCQDYSKVFADAMEYFNGIIPNIENLSVLTTMGDTDYGQHAWNIFITTDKEGNLIFTFADLTWVVNGEEKNKNEFIKEINAADSRHFYEKKNKNENNPKNK